MRKFFWQGGEENKKMVMVPWKNICKLKEFGGVGLRNQLWLNKALGANCNGDV